MFHSAAAGPAPHAMPMTATRSSAAVRRLAIAYLLGYAEYKGEGVGPRGPGVTILPMRTTRSEDARMQQRRATEFSQELLNLFDCYVHGDIDRRGFLEHAGKFAVGGMTAAMLLDALSPRFAEAQQVAKDDKRLHAQWIDYESPQGSGKMRAYLVRPEAVTAKLPGVLVVHENRGLNPHIEDIARRLALDNFVVLAPDALTPLGGYPGDEDKAREAFGKLDQA